MPVGELLVAFTSEELKPLVVPNFTVLAADRDLEQRVAGMRAEERRYAWLRVARRS